VSGTPETTREQRWAQAIRAARMTWTGGGDGDFDALLARTALALADAEAATARARQLPNDVCGATDQDGAVVCMLPPHSVELLPEGDANHHRWHQDWRGGSLWAEWSSVTDDDAGRLWPDGHIGPRAARVVD
jgi:hypothetical protein